MKKLNLFLLIAFLLSSCAPATTTVPSFTPMPTQTATLTPTNTPKPTSTSTPTPKIYTLRIEFSTTSDWSRLIILDSGSILNARIVNKQGNPTDFSFSETGLGLNQTLADAQELKEVSITVDFDISESATNGSIPFLLQKGALNDSNVSFYNVLNGTKYMLLDEVYRAGYVEGNTDLNPYHFSFDLEHLFQDVAAIATLTQNEVLTGKLIFDYSSFEYHKDFPDEKGETNVFIANVDGTNLTPVTNMEGFNFLKNVSPDGTKALFVSASDWKAKTANLYLVDLRALNSEPVKLAKGLPFVGHAFNRSAVWLDNTKISYIGQGEKGFGIYTMNIDGTNQVNTERNNPFEILAMTPERVYWSTHIEKPYLNGTTSSFEVWYTNLDGSETAQLKYRGEKISIAYNKNAVAISPDGTKIAWVDLSIPADPQDFHHYLYIASLSDIDNALVLEAGPSQIKWRLDGKSILAFGVGVGDGVSKTDISRDTYGLFEVSAESATVIKNFRLGDNILGRFGSDIVGSPLQCFDISLDGQLLPCLTFEVGRNAEGRTPAKLIFINLETASYKEVSGIKFFFLTWTPRTMIWLQ
jgi:Tol biopolymer transport system component